MVLTGFFLVRSHLLAHFEWFSYGSPGVGSSWDAPQTAQEGLDRIGKRDPLNEAQPCHVSPAVFWYNQGVGRVVTRDNLGLGVTSKQELLGV